MKSSKLSPGWRWALHILPAMTLAVSGPTAFAQGAKTRAADAREVEATETSADSEGSKDAATAVKDAWSNAVRETEKAITSAADVGRSFAVAFASGGLPRTLVLPGGRLGAEAADRMTEDLAVMSRILQKAARPSDANKAYFWSDFAGNHSFNRSLEAMYLDGFGAMFLISVDFPLVRPQEPAGGKEAEVTDETWERARQELRGRNDLWSSTLGLKVLGAEGAEPFKASRVEELKDDLIDALKHASNLKDLTENESITVAVFGPGNLLRARALGIRRGKAVTLASGDDDDPAENLAHLGQISGLAGKGPRPSILALRVKKADVDAFAKGTLDRSQFAGRVRVTIR